MKDTIYSREQYLRKKAAEKEPLNIQSVSYTHLTLPTIA